MEYVIYRSADGRFHILRRDFMDTHYFSDYLVTNTFEDAERTMKALDAYDPRL